MSCAWAGAYARVWNRNWRRVDASNPYTSVCLCVCRLMAISLLVNMKNACKADFFSRFFAAIVWRTEAKRTRRQCCQRSQQETLNLKSSEMFLNSGWWDDEKIMCVFVPFLGRYNLLADGSRKRAMMSSRVCVCVCVWISSSTELSDLPCEVEPSHLYCLPLLLWRKCNSWMCVFQSGLCDCNIY